MTAPVEIQTERLLLKGINPKLINGLFNTKTKEEIMQFFGADEAGYEHYKSMHEKGMETHRLSLFFFLLLDKKDNRILGECGFHTLNATHRRTELFYSMRNDSDKQKGLMTEALRAVLDYGSCRSTCNRLEYTVSEIVIKIWLYQRRHDERRLLC
jgi:ribosomal-protein-alanine N-acetyltransferase